MSTTAHEAGGERTTSRSAGEPSDRARLHLVASASVEQRNGSAGSQRSCGERASDGTVRRALSQSVAGRREEIEGLILHAVRAVDGRPEVEDEAYAAAMPAVVRVGLESCLAVIASPRDLLTSPPDLMVEQVRRAAKLGIDARTVVRRIFAAHGVIEAVLDEHALALGITATSEQLAAISVDVGALFEALVAGATDEYAIACARTTRAPEERRLDLVLRLLDGDDEAAAALRHELHDHTHLGLIACDERVEATLRDIAGTAHLCILAVKAPDGERWWAWLSGPELLPTRQIEGLLGAHATAGASYAIGAPSAGLDGWRRTHAQARAALRLASFVPRTVTSYAANPLLATALCDEPLRAWLGDFVARLDACDERSTGLAAALAAYIDAGFNAASAAASLEVGRRTVERRLADAETLIGRPLRSCAGELRLALQLRRLGAQPR